MATQVYRLQGPDGKVYRIEGPAGASASEVEAFAAQAIPKFSAPREEPPVDPATANLDPRDMAAQRRPAPATTPGGVLREVTNIGPLGSVMRGARDVIEGAGQLFFRGANKVGLASDETVRRADAEVRRSNAEYDYATGRKPGEFDGWRAAGNIAATLPLAPARLLQAASLPGRMAGGAGVGAIGASVQPVTEGDFGAEKTKQVATGAVAGAVGTPVAEGLARVAVPAINSAANAIRGLGARFSPQRADNLLAQALEANGVKWSQLGEDVRQALREDISSALRVGGETDAAALRRLADIRAVGATPTRGSVTLDPVQITTERNLAKVGANSTDPQLQRLAQVESDNNAALIARLNQLQGGNPADEFSTGARVIDALRGRDAQAQNTVRDLYRRAEDMNAGAITLDGMQFVNVASRALDESRRGAFLPGQVRTVMQEIADRQQRGVQMTLNDVEQLRTILAAEARKASRSGDGNAQAAISVVRDALEGTPTDSLRGEAANAAFNRARAAHRARMQMREESPALAAALDGAEPDRFVRQFITGGGATVADVRALQRSIAGSPEALDAVRGQIVNHLKSRALSGAADETGTFSQSAFNKALNEIGDRKLAAFFSPDEIGQLRQVGRAATYLQVQPKGSAVNNSNTASAAIGALDRVLSRTPVVGEWFRGPLNNALAARQATNALRQTLPITGRDVIDDRTRNALIAAGVPLGGSLGLVAGAQN